MLLSSISNAEVFILPKGSVKKGEKGKQAAVRETLEEAGVLGKLRVGKIGQFEYKTHKGKMLNQKMWLLDVERELPKSDPLWMEGEKRTRRWSTFEDARNTVRNAPVLRPEILTILDAAENHLHLHNTGGEETSAKISNEDTQIPAGVILCKSEKE